MKYILSDIKYQYFYVHFCESLILFDEYIFLKICMITITMAHKCMHTYVWEGWGK